MRGGNGLQGLQKLLPQGGVFLLGGRVLCGFAFFARLGKDGLWRERLERVAPLQALQAVRCGRAAGLHLLQQRQQPRLVVVAARGGIGVAFGCCVVGVEGFPLEAAGQSVGSCNDPLQKGFRPVVCGSGIDQRVCSWHITTPASTSLQLRTVDERCHVAVNQIGNMAFDVVESHCGVGRMHMTVVAGFTAGRCAVPGAVLGFVRIQRL